MLQRKRFVNRCESNRKMYSILETDCWSHSLLISLARLAHRWWCDNEEANEHSWRVSIAISMTMMTVRRRRTCSAGTNECMQCNTWMICKSEYNADCDCEHRHAVLTIVISAMHLYLHTRHSKRKSTLACMPVDSIVSKCNRGLLELNGWIMDRHPRINNSLKNSTLVLTVRPGELEFVCKISWHYRLISSNPSMNPSIHLARRNTTPSQWGGEQPVQGMRIVVIYKHTFYYLPDIIIKCINSVFAIVISMIWPSHVLFPLWIIFKFQSSRSCATP
jgi:hypothetical protein